MKKTIICVVGRNSAGKTTIAKKIAEEFGLKVVQSYTTRPPRNSEIKNGLENSDHIFISESEFDELEKNPDNIAAATVINDVRYCTTIDILKKSDIYVIDPQGVIDLQSKFGKEFHIVQFYIYANEDIRKTRFMSRGETSDLFDKRNASENRQFSEYEGNHYYDIVIYNNGNIDDAVKTMGSYVSIIMEGRPKTKDCDQDVTENIKQVDYDDTEVKNICPSEEHKDDAQDNNSNTETKSQESESENNIEESEDDIFSRFSVDDDNDKDKSNEPRNDMSEDDMPESENIDNSNDEDIIIIE